MNRMGIAETKSEMELRVTEFRAFARTRLGVAVLTFVGAALLLLSFRFAYWNLALHAPQYPDGLHLSIYMDHVTGDVSEVNLLNHYIGMSHLDDAAQFERRYAWYGLLLLALGAVVAIPVAKRAFRVFYLPPILFLAGFLGDLFFWLYQAGHRLNPDAPVHIRPFTPMLLGSGKIGQFITSASLGFGFWIALAASGILTYVIYEKRQATAVAVSRTG
jgi:hypothetical protein